MSKVGLACAFRHYSDDGALIPASTVVEGGPLDGKVAPIIGYIAAFDGSRTVWGFMKYEAPSIFPKYQDGKWVLRSGDNNRAANIATTRVGRLNCPSCGQSVPTPIHGGKKEHREVCPCCGAKHTNVDQIKENSPEFLEMLGDLKDPIEEAAKLAYSTDPVRQFVFPMVVAGSPEIAPGEDASVPDDIQNLAAAHGRGFKSLAGMASLQDLVDVGNEDEVDLSIVPGIYAGIMDDAEIRDGRSWNSGAVSYYLRMWLPERKRQASFKAFRY